MWFQDEARIGQKNSLPRVWGHDRTEPSKVFSLQGAKAVVSVCLSSFRACRCSLALPTWIMESEVAGDLRS